jgi:hypothetical protein
MKRMRRTETKAEAEMMLTQVFEEHVAELYWLAYLITGDQDRSVQAFTDALDCDEANPTFREFMISWARKLVVVAALSLVLPFVNTVTYLYELIR